MIGAIFYATRYGNTKTYAGWIAEATALPAFDIRARHGNPADYDFLVLGSPVIRRKLLLHGWVRRHADAIVARPAILFSVSAAGGQERDGWIADSLPAEIAAHLDHVALRGRRIPAGLTWYDRIMGIHGGRTTHGRAARREALHRFDHLDRSATVPVVSRVRRLQAETRGGTHAPGRQAPSR